jgi:hypothetical protein
MVYTCFYCKEESTEPGMACLDVPVPHDGKTYINCGCELRALEEANKNWEEFNYGT